MVDSLNDIRIGSGFVKSSRFGLLRAQKGGKRTYGNNKENLGKNRL
jgi:hypothetical protein